MLLETNINLVHVLVLNLVRSNSVATAVDTNDMDDSMIPGYSVRPYLDRHMDRQRPLGHTAIFASVACLEQELEQEPEHSGHGYIC